LKVGCSFALICKLESFLTCLQLAENLSVVMVVFEIKLVISVVMVVFEIKIHSKVQSPFHNVKFWPMEVDILGHKII